MLYHKVITAEIPSNEWVVFVHGAGGSSSIWYKQLRAFKAHFNVLLLDLRGHGKSAHRSEKELNPYTFHDVAEDVIHVLDHLKIKQAHFIGISLGSMLIRIIGEKHMDRVKSMILGGAILRFNYKSRFLVFSGNLLKRVVPFIWLYKIFAFAIMPKKRHKESRNLFINEAKRLYQKEFLRWFTLTYQINPIFKLFRERELPVPTLYLMGKEDHLFLPSVIQLVGEQPTYNKLEVVPDSGHVCNVDQPDYFNTKAIEFIHKHS